jgi:ATP adenylyltransferase
MMEQLYTPWRREYVTAGESKKIEGCVFCATFKDDVAGDRKNYLIYRGKATFVIMNIYPYNIGHLMILPHEHVSTLVDMSSEAQKEMMQLAAYFTNLLSKLMNSDGFNLGINVGRAAGAGIEDHLHMHLVPRWNGDSNFMSVIANTRVLPETLDDTYERIVNALKQQPPEIF